MASEDPAFLFYPGNYLRDTQCLSEPAQVAYDRIMCEHMRNICISQAQLDFFTKRLTADQKSEVMMVLRASDAGYFIPWVHDAITKRREYSESRRKNRTSKKEKDPPKGKKISSSYVPHMENENTIENEIGISLKKEPISKLKIFESLFEDEIYLEQLALTHKGKDLKSAFEECYTHHSNAPNPPQEIWEWKQKLNTWLSIKKQDNGQHTKNGKQTPRDLATALQHRVMRDAQEQRLRENGNAPGPDD